jgi:hypothetical protein
MIDISMTTGPIVGLSRSAATRTARSRLPISAPLAHSRLPPALAGVLNAALSWYAASAMRLATDARTG